MTFCMAAGEMTSFYTVQEMVRTPLRIFRTATVSYLTGYTIDHNDLNFAVLIPTTTACLGRVTLP